MWTESRNTEGQELQPYVRAIAGTLGLCLFSIVIASFQVVRDNFAILTAPFLYAADLLAVLLLSWAFTGSLWKEQRGKVAIIGLATWASLLVFMTVLWTQEAFNKPVDYAIHSWQVPVWYLLVLATAGTSTVLVWRERDKRHSSIVTPGAFAILGVGALFQLLGCEFLGALLPSGDGLGRLLMILGYSLFSITLYDASLSDLQSYREELRGLTHEALRQSQELLFLIEATRSIGESLDLGGMLGRVAENVAMALRADRVAIFLCEQSVEDKLFLAASYEVLMGDAIVHRQITLNEYPVLQDALKEGQTVYETEQEFASRRKLFKLLGVDKNGPLLVQPLARREHPIGVLVACNDYSGKSFTSEHTKLATTISVQIAAAVDNSRLYQAVEAKATELSTLLKARMTDLRRQEAIFESMAEGVLVTDAEGNVVLINAAAEEILDVRRDEVVDGPLTLLLERVSVVGKFGPEILVSLDAPLETILDLTGQKVRVHAAPVRLNDGNQFGIVAILQDITPELRAEESKRNFITSISHELRTPLTAIKGYTEIMLSGMSGELSDTVQNFLRVIRENSVRMAALTDNIISVAEIERGRIGLSYQEVNLVKIMEEVIGHYSARITERKQEVVREIPSESLTVYADSYRLRLVLDNLMDNAVKFSYPGDTITLGCRAISEKKEGKTSFVAVWITDTGVGIPLTEQPKIWDRFYRVDNPLSLEAGGLGIGLTIAKALVTAHRGRIWVDSKPDEGSTFTILLPTQQDQDLSDLPEEVLL